MAIVKLNISGMHCSACSGTIEKNLQKIPAITNIKINAVSGLAKIAYKESEITEAKIIELITSYGFPASLDKTKALEEAYIKSLRQRLFIAIPLFLVIFILHMGGIHGTFSYILQLTLASVVQFYCGLPFYQGAKNVLKTKSADMNLLIALGTSVAYIYSLCLFFSGASGFYFEGSSAVICFVLVGEYLKAKAKKSASDGINLLASILPNQARILKDNKEEWIAVDKIQKGDLCLVLSGEKIPLDGIVRGGQAEVSSAHINGEELPKYITKDDLVVGGSVLVNGELTIESLKDSNAFFVYEMLDLLEISQMQKPPIGRLADKIASIFVPSVVLISVLAFIVWILAGESVAFALSIAACVLIISCPCALGLAVPLAIVSASLRAKKAEILVKTPQIYEQAAQIKTIVFDKTGTLTKGEICVEKCEIFNTTCDFVLGIAKSMQERNPHPISKAILEYCKDIEAKELQTQEYVISKGVVAEFNGEKYYLGNLEWVAQNARISIQEQSGIIAFAKKDTLLALFYLKDSIKENAESTLKALKKLGIESVILSGDNAKNVEKIAKTLDIAHYFAGFTPEQKAQKVAEFAKNGGVCFVGDGINDALALKEASFGISFIEATQLAQEVGDVLLLKNDLWGIVEVFHLSCATLKNIRQNLFFAYIYNIILIPIAAGILYPLFGIVLQSAFAGAAMALSSLSVVFNALRINTLRLPKCI